MTVLFDLTSLFDNLSGIERYAMNISLEMIKQDSKNNYILIFKNEIHKAFCEITDYENVEIVIIKGKNKLIFNQLLLCINLYKYKADAYVFLAFQSPLLFKRKNIYNTVHDLVCWDCPETMKKTSEIYFKTMIKNAIKVSKGIITISEFSTDRIVQKFNYDRKKMHLIYCGVSDDFRKFDINNQEVMQSVKEKYNLPDHYLLCLSTLEPRKNMGLLIEAYKCLVEEKVICNKLVLVGRKGWKIDKMIESIPEGLRNNIIVTGFVEDKDLPYIYTCAKCFIFPSKYEGFGMPPLEAMAAGTPVISSDAASLLEVIGNSGVVFVSEDIVDLKQKISDVFSMTDGEIRKIIIEQKSRSGLFVWSKEATKLLNIIC